MKMPRTKTKQRGDRHDGSGARPPRKRGKGSASRKERTSHVRGRDYGAMGYVVCLYSVWGSVLGMYVQCMGQCIGYVRTVYGAVCWVCTVIQIL